MTENQIIEYFEDYVLPGVKEAYEQDNIIDGPGLPLFVIAWVILIILNSNR